jgi:hypothetical protein
MEEEIELIDDIERPPPRQYTFRERINFNAEGDEFRRRFRISREAALWLLEQIRPDIQPRANYNHSLDAWQKMLICVRVLATGEHDIGVGDQFGPTKTTVIKCVSQCVRAICRKYHRIVRWPEDEQRRQEIRTAFQE